MGGFIAFLFYASLIAGVITLIVALVQKRRKRLSLILFGIAALMLVAYQFTPDDSPSDETRSSQRATKNHKDRKSAKKIATSKSESKKAASQKLASAQRKASSIASSKAASTKAVKKQAAAKQSSKKAAAIKSSIAAAEKSKSSSLVAVRSKKKTAAAQPSRVALIGKKVKKEGIDFSGATIYNGVLTLLLSDDVAYNGVIGGKMIQKGLLTNIMSEVSKYKDSPLAKNGILVTGAYIKDDDGYHVPTIALYYNADDTHNSDLSDFNLRVEKPLNAVYDASASYIFGKWLMASGSKGIYEGVHLVNVQTAPSWFEGVYTGETPKLKPTKL